MNYLLRLSKRFKNVLLALVIILFIASAISCVFQLRQTIRLLESPKSSTSWAVVQLQTEHRRFISSLQLYRLGGVEKAELLLRYDILWSRIPVLLEGQESAAFQSNQNATQLVRKLFKDIQRIEPLLQTLAPDNDKLPRIVERLQSYTTPINSLVNKEFQRNSEFDYKTDIRLLRLQFILAFSIGGLSICGLILIIWILRENHLNRYLAHHDTLTGLPNRAGLREFIAGLENNRRDYAIMVLDLNGFKGINDSYGHQFGDQILNLVGQRLQGQMRACDYAVRLGGDEFAIVQTRVRSPDDSSGFAQRLIDVIEKPIALKGRECFVGSSIGISLALDNTHDWLTILGQADTAMYLAKQRVKGSSWQFFEGKMQLAQEREQQLLSQLRDALESQQLGLFYQPIVSLSKEQVVAAEVQVRWQHSSYGLIKQRELLDLAQACGCVVEMESWVLREASRQLKRWQHQHNANLQLVVSISSSTLQSDFLSLVNKVLIESRILPHRLIINIIDSNQHLLLNSVEAICELRRIGVSLSLDNFGSAECPLELLNHLPVQYLRGADSLMSELLSAADEQPLLTATVLFANRLGVQLMVSGVDNQRHLAHLKAITQELLVLGAVFADWVPAENFELDSIPSETL